MTSVKIPARCEQILGYEDVAWFCLEQQERNRKVIFFLQTLYIYILRCTPMDLTALIIQCFRDVRYHWCGPLFGYLLWTCLPVCCIPRFLVRNGTAQQEVHARTPSSKAFVSRHFVEASGWIHMRAWSRFFVRMLCSANKICDVFTMLSIIGVWTDFGKVVNDFSFHFSLKITHTSPPVQMLISSLLYPVRQFNFKLPVSHCRPPGLNITLVQTAYKRR